MLSGLVVAGVLNLIFWTGIALAVRAAYRSQSNLNRLFAIGVIGFVVLIVGMEIMSQFSCLRRIPMFGFAGVTLLSGLFLTRRQQRASGQPATPVPAECSGASYRLEAGGSDGASSIVGHGWSDLARQAMVFLGAWGAVYYLLRGLVLPVEPVSDAPIYHLPLALRWWQAGRIEWLATPFGEQAAPYFPANGDLWFTWLFIGGENELLAKIGQWPFLVLAALAIVRLAQLAGAKTGGVFPAAVWLLTPPALVFSPVAIVDLFFAAWYLISVVFLIEHYRARRCGADGTAELLLMGLAAGLALGSKSIGLAFVPWLLLPVAKGAFADPRGTAVRLLIAVAAIAVPSAFWFLRNWLVTGNPIYPLHVELFGLPVFHGWYDRAVMLKSGYHQPTADWLAIVGQLGSVLDLRIAWVWPAVAAFGLFIPGRATGLGDGRSCARPLLLFGLLHLVLFWWVIPYNTQHRFLLAGLGLMLVPLAPLVENRWWLQWPLVALTAWHLLGPQWLAPMPSRPVVLLPIGRDLLSLGSVVHWLALPASLAVALVFIRQQRLSAGAARAASTAANFGRSWCRYALAVAIVGIGAAVTAWPGARILWQDPLLRFYPMSGFAKELFPAWTALDRLTAGRSSNVAYAGTNLPYYLYGAGLRHRPTYVNVAGPAGWQMHDFHRERLRAGVTRRSDDPFPQWHRERANYDTWRGNLEVLNIEWLIVARENLHGRKVERTGPAPFPIEHTWAQQHPERFEPFGPFLSSGQTEPFAWLYRVRRDLPAMRR